jgi:hypothetical protein
LTRAGGGFGVFNTSLVGFPNSGHGGSGADFDGNNARAGRDGVVILRYRIP